MRNTETVPRTKKRLRDVADHIDRRMHAQTGSVTLHYVNGKLERAEYRQFESADTMPELRTE